MCRLGIFGIVLALLAATPRAARPPAGEYRAIVEQFADTPDEAITKMLALPGDAVGNAVRDATRAGSNWTVDAIDRALLLHGDAAIALAPSGRCSIDQGFA